MNRRRRTPSSRALFAALTFAGAGLSACFPCCGDTVAGDAAQALEVEAMVFQPGGYVVPSADGAAQLQVIAGSQGGLMIIAGVRARNLDTCGVTVDARLLTPGEQVISSASLDKNLSETSGGAAEIVDDDGSGGLILFPCDGQVKGVGEPRILEVTVRDREGRSGTSRVTFTPTCGSYGEWCEQQCTPWDAPDAGRDGGSDAGADAGADAGTDGGM